MNRRNALWLGIALVSGIFAVSACAAGTATGASGIRDGLAFTADMKIGWNLGNTLDAQSDTNSLSNELSYETYWGNPATTQAMITAVRNAGFNTIRIPVSWHNHVTPSGASYTISSTWMSRVKTVVDYAYGSGMYVILNIHHDNSTSYLYPTTAYLTQSENYVKSIWSQVATAFSSYDEHLIFEGMNEPRMVGSTYEWWLDMGNSTCVDAVNCINTLNQDFVATVRASTGYNATRYLMVPGYAASPSSALLSAFSLPTDTVSNRLIVSVHAYTPYNFALQATTETGSVSTFSAASSSSTADIESFLSSLYARFIAKGIPVVIGEFGARDKSGNTTDRAAFSSYYIKVARSYGITACWWDNGSFSTAAASEAFGLLNRSSLAWPYPGIISALMEYARAD